MRVKSSYLFALIKSELGNEIFDEFLKDYLTSRTFTDSSAEDFLNELNDEFWLEMSLESDPSIRFLVVRSDDAPLGGGRWREGAFVYRDGELRPL